MEKGAGMNELIKQDLPDEEEYIAEENIEGSFRSAEDPPPPPPPLAPGAKWDGPRLLDPRLLADARLMDYATRPLPPLPKPRKKTISPYVPNGFVYMTAIATVWYILWIMSMLQHP